MLTAAETRALRAKLEAEVERLSAAGRGGLALAASRERTTGDEADASSSEELFSTAMRFRDREKYLLDKVRAQLRRLAAGEVDECLGCGEPIGYRRLLARPVATLCLGCKEREERRERSQGGGGEVLDLELA